MNYFFDTSALVKVYHYEEGTDKVLNIYNSETKILISELAKLEFYSSIYRKYRERAIDLNTLNLLNEKFDFDTKNRYDIRHFSSGVTEQAQKYLKEFGESRGIKTLDSLQLAFFYFYCESEDTFVCWDTKLLKIAEKENMKVLVL